MRVFVSNYEIFSGLVVWFKLSVVSNEAFNLATTPPVCLDVNERQKKVENAMTGAKNLPVEWIEHSIFA
jgi:hypothetical protein